MNRFSTLLLGLGLAFPALVPGEAKAQRNAISAQEAVGLVSTEFGPQSVQWIAEMRARGGVPQPSDWEVLVYDQRMPRLLYRFWATVGRVVDGGPDEERYPLNIPIGYFSPNQVGVDSVAAFTIAEGEARKARVAFDSCDYLLRVREYSTEPLWRLELFDARQQIVGKIYISATSGAVMRTVWIYRDERALSSSRPRIVDSLAPSGGGAPGASPGLSGPGLSSNTLPPLESGDDRTAGIAVGPPVDGPAPGQNTGIAQMPPRTTPAPYRPVDPSGSPTGAPSNSSPVDNSIPEPPAPEGESKPAMRDLREAPAPAPESGAQPPDPSRPPIDVPEGSSGSSERIPPPPVPR